MGRVFNSKLASFAVPSIECMAPMQPLLELKTQLRLSPAGHSMPMIQPTLGWSLPWHHALYSVDLMLTKKSGDQMSVDKMASWPNNKLTKWQVDKGMCWPNGRLIEKFVDQIACWPKIRLNKWSIYQVTGWWNALAPIAGVNLIKLFKSKYIHSFCQQDYFITINFLL